MTTRRASLAFPEVGIEPRAGGGMNQHPTVAKQLETLHTRDGRRENRKVVWPSRDPGFMRG